MSQNPFRQALLSIGIFGLIAALVIFILAVIPYNSDPEAIADPFFWIRDLLPRAPWLLLAGFIGTFSGASLLAWVYGSAKRWTAPAE